MKISSSSTHTQKLDSGHDAYIEKLGERPLMTQFNICIEHIEKDLALHWPLLDDPQMEEKAHAFIWGPVKNEIKNFGDQNDYPDILVTIIVAKNSEIVNLPPFEEANLTRFETASGYVLILICQESPWHAPPSVFGDHGCITKLEGDEDVYRYTERFLDMFFGRNGDLYGLGAKDAMRNSIIRLHQYGESNMILKQGLYHMFFVLGLLSGKENVESTPKPAVAAIATIAAVVGNDSIFILEPIIKAVQAFALTRLMDPNLTPQQRLYFRGLAQQIYGTFEPPIAQAAHIAAAHIDQHHVVHPDAQKAHQDAGLRQKTAQHHQTLEPGMDGGGSEG